MYVHNGFSIYGFMHSNPGTAGVTLDIFGYSGTRRVPG